MCRDRQHCLLSQFGAIGLFSEMVTGGPLGWNVDMPDGDYPIGGFGQMGVMRGPPSLGQPRVRTFGRLIRHWQAHHLAVGEDDHHFLGPRARMAGHGVGQVEARGTPELQTAGPAATPNPAWADAYSAGLRLFTERLRM